MSLHALADHMAAKGRGGDSMLVHMSKDEVRALQALAERHGKTLTINPETGQPEAFSLKSLLPMIAGFALGPAGFGLMSAGMAGAAVGGITALATGDISRGLMAGMGAYGGAGLGEALMGAGASTLGAGEVGSEALKNAGYTSEIATGTPLSEAGSLMKGAAQQVPMMDQLTAGAKAAMNNPMEFAKANWKPLAAAAVSPMLASEGVQTTTPRPTDTGNIRKFSYDPYGQTYTPLGVYPAADYKGMAGGGIVALADGGPAPGSTQYVENVKNWFAANPNATYQDVQGAIQQYGLNPTDVQSAMQQAGLSGAAQYAAFHPDIGAAANVAETQGGLSGLSSNINYWMQQNPGASLNDVRSEMGKWDLSDADILRATGKTPEQLTTGALTGVYNPAPGAGGNTSAVVNPNGTITEVALPPSVTTNPLTGQPAPTATIQNIKDLYTAGGGSLGQSNLYVPQTYEEFQKRYTNTGGSQQAYDYLMNKGAADIKKPWTPTGELMRPYKETVMGIPAVAGRPTQKYIFENGAYKINPDYQPLSFDSTGKRIVGASTNQINTAIGKGDASVQALVDAGTVDYVTLGALLGITAAEAEKRFPRKNATASTTAGTGIGDTGGGSGHSASADSSSGNPGGPGASSAADSASFGGDSSGDGAPGDKRGGLIKRMALGGLGALAGGGQAMYNLGGYSDGGRLLRGPGDGVSDSIPAIIGDKQPARLADGEFVVPARIVSELGNGSTEAGARKLYAMMDRVQRARGKTTGKGKVANDTRADKYLPA